MEAAGDRPKRQIRRGVIEERGEDPRSPEELRRGGQPQLSSPRVQEHQRWDHRNKDTSEKHCHLNNRTPAEAVFPPNFSPSRDHREDSHEYHPSLLYSRGGFEGPTEQDGQDHPSQPDEIELTGDPERSRVACLDGQVHLGIIEVPVVGPSVDADEEEEQGSHHERPGGEKPESPKEGYPPEESEEQWWISKRSEQSSDIAHQEDEENHHVRLLLANSIGSKDGANQEHRCPRRPNQRSQYRPDSQHERVHHWCPREIAPNHDSPGNHE